MDRHPAGGRPADEPVRPPRDPGSELARGYVAVGVLSRRRIAEGLERAGQDRAAWLYRSNIS